MSVQVPVVGGTVQATMRTTEVDGEQISQQILVNEDGDLLPYGTYDDPIYVNTTGDPLPVSMETAPVGSPTEATQLAVQAAAEQAASSLSDIYSVDSAVSTTLGNTGDAAVQDSPGSVIGQLRGSQLFLSAAVSALGAVADAESVSGNGSIIAILKRLRTRLNGALSATLAAGTALIGRVQLDPQSSNGLLNHYRPCTNSTNAVSASPAASLLYGWTTFNKGASPVYLKLYNTVGVPNPAVDPPVMVLPIPGNSAGAVHTEVFAIGMTFTNGIAFAVVAGISDTDNTPIPANEVLVNLLYCPAPPS